MNERRLLQKSRRERYEVRDDVVDLTGIEPATLRMRTVRSPS